MDEKTLAIFDDAHKRFASSNDIERCRQCGAPMEFTGKGGTGSPPGNDDIYAYLVCTGTKRHEVGVACNTWRGDKAARALRWDGAQWIWDDTVPTWEGGCGRQSPTDAAEG